MKYILKFILVSLGYLCAFIIFSIIHIVLILWCFELNPVTQVKKGYFNTVIKKRRANQEWAELYEDFINSIKK